MGRQQRAQIEAFYMISHGKSPEEIQYTVEGDRAKRITQARGEVSGTMTYINSALAGSAHGAIAGYAFCMAPYAAPALLYGTGAGYAGSMVGLSEEMMISLTETALYALNFSNIVVQGSDMVESTTGERFKGCSGGQPVPYGGAGIGDGCDCDSDSGAVQSCIWR